MNLQRAAYLAALLVVLVTPALSADGQQADGPRIALSQERWDFGSVAHPKTTELVLTVTNQGSGELRITDIKSSCACTVAEPERRTLQAGESTKVKVVFSSKGKQGKVRARIAIYSNDRTSPKKELKISGVVTRLIEVTPLRGVAFRVLDPNVVRTRDVRLVNTGADPMQPKLGSFPSGQFSAELKEIRPGRECVVAVSIRPPVKQKVLSDTAELTTGLAAEPKITIRANVLLMDRVSLRPPAIYVGLKEDEPKQYRPVIEYFGDDPNFRILRVACDDPSVKTRLSSPKKGGPSDGGLAPTMSFVLTIEFPPTTVFPPEGLLFKIFTNDPEYSELTLFTTADLEQYRQRGRELIRQNQRRESP